MDVFDAIVLSARAHGGRITVHGIGNTLAGSVTGLFKEACLIVALVTVMFTIMTVLLFRVILDRVFRVMRVGPTFPVDLDIIVIVNFVTTVVTYRMHGVVGISPSRVLTGRWGIWFRYVGVWGCGAGLGGQWEL